MRKIIEKAVQELCKQGYQASRSNIGGFIDVIEPAVIRSGGQPDRIVNEKTTIHHTRVWEFINERS
jgi:hypothetical protein